MSTNDKLKIVFVPRRSRIRPYKIAKSLKYTGKVHLILVCEESFYDKELFEGVFDEVHFFTRRNVLFKLPKAEKIYRRINQRFGFGFNKMLRIIRSINPDLIHCFAEPYNHIASILKNTSYKVVMTDGADFTGITRGVENLEPWLKAEEKYCFENVSGLIYKGPKYVTDYYRSQGYKVSCAELTWVDHADSDLFESVKTIAEYPEKKELHLVYTGNISVDPTDKSYCYYIPLAHLLIQQKIHFHIYPNPYQYSTSQEYLNLDKSSRYFHFHESLPLKKLIKEIKDYDIGLWIHGEETSSRTSEAKRKTGIGNKLFTYLEAGLPVIVSSSREYGSDFINSNKIGFDIQDQDWNGIGDKLKSTNIAELLQNVEQVRNSFSLEKCGDELVGFYIDLIN